MADFRDDKCQTCPYLNQNHLKEAQYFQERNIPLSIENRRDSKTLIVLQSPGEVEWEKGKPLQSAKKVVQGIVLTIHGKEKANREKVLTLPMQFNVIREKEITVEIKNLVYLRNVYVING